MAEREDDYLRYRGNAFPRFLRFAWTIFVVGGGIYLALYMWPDLLEWLKRV